MEDNKQPIKGFHDTERWLCFDLIGDLQRLLAMMVSVSEQEKTERTVDLFFAITVLCTADDCDMFD